MRFFKAHGLGNDYLVAVDASAPLDPHAVRAYCDRHRGFGADGILEPTASRRADHGVRIWNPDGSVAEKSGNGLRIFAYWLSRDRGVGDRFSVDTGTDVVRCEVDGRVVTVEMGVATVGPWRDQVVPASTLGAGEGELRVTEVRIGNPHAVVWAPGADLDALPWRTWGAALEQHPHFPERTNVQFVEPLPDGAAIRIWERGAGETSASGSSSCAVAAVAAARGHQPVDVTQAITMPGGVLHVIVRGSGEVRLRGPVAPVGTLDVDAEYDSGP